ncbi:hypothetical protein LCGC14_3005030, partial [marine sediment metagenome]
PLALVMASKHKEYRIRLTGADLDELTKAIKQRLASKRIPVASRERLTRLHSRFLERHVGNPNL